MKTHNKFTSLMVGGKKSATLLGLAASMMATSSTQAVELLNLMVEKSGIHRITYEQLAAEGADLRGLKSRKFNITTDGVPVPMRVVGQSSNGKGKTKNSFGPGGYIEFYAQPEASLYSTEQAYTLHFLNNRELRKLPRNEIAIDKAKVKRRVNSATTYYHTKVVEKNVYYDFSAPSKVDPWHFGQNYSIFNTPTHKFDLDNVAGGSGTASLQVEIYGLLDFNIEGNDHHYEVVMNDIVVGDQQFDGNAIDYFAADDVVINEGSNSFKYNFRPIAEVPFDVIALNLFKVTYERNTVSEGEYIDGRFVGAQAAVSGINSEDYSVYRVNSKDQIELLTGATKNGDLVTFNTSNIDARYIVAGISEDPLEKEIGHLTPRVQNLLTEVDIKSGDAEYLVITHGSLIGDELDELVQLRSRDYAVKVVNVEQIYSQFGDYVADPLAIFDYIKYAKESLNTRFVVFVGNDTYDYKGLSTNSVSLIPTRYVATKGGLLLVTQTPSDAAYGDLDGNGVPELPVGRISVRTKAELAAVVNKLKAYEQRDGYAGRVLVAADKEDVGNGLSFTQDAEALIAAMPSSWATAIRSDFKAYPDVDGGQLAHDKTVKALNAGVSVVNFIGHSSHRRWSFSTPPILTSTEVSKLTNIGKPSLVTQWGCWNSYFVDPKGNTMADEFLLAGEMGAATVLGASTLTTSEGERALGVELNKRMYTKGLTIGEAVVQAKQALATKADFPPIQFGWQIIGDPALKVNP